MTTPRGGPVNLPALTGYRFILAFMVIACHGFYSAELYEPGATADALAIMAPLAIVAVSSFFILSGFILTWSAPAGDTTTRFYRRRFWKIFPNHVLTWGLMLFVFAFVATGGSPPIYGFQDNLVSIPEALTNLLLVQNWFYSAEHVTGVNSPAWSISVEMFFYLLFPVLLVLVKKIRERRLWMWTGLVAALVLLAPLPTYAITGPDYAPWAPLPEAQMWLVYAFPPVRLLEFVLGILLARLVQSNQWRPIKVRYAAIPLVAVVLLSPQIPPAYLFAAAFALPCALLIPTIAMVDITGKRIWLQKPAIVALGNASFALYLVHGPILYALRDLLGTSNKFDPATATAIVLSFMLVSQAAAFALYRYWEVPLMRRFSRPRTQKPTRTSSPPTTPARTPAT